MSQLEMNKPRIPSNKRKVAVLSEVDLDEPMLPSRGSSSNDIEAANCENSYGALVQILTLGRFATSEVC